MHARFAIIASSLGVGFVAATPANAGMIRWGQKGHMIIAEAAVAALPEQMPAFFRRAGAQLIYLNPEPDRWRDSREGALDKALDEARSPEHFIDLEAVPKGALLAPNRYAYLDSLKKGGQTQSVGLLPYQIIELTQSLRIGFRQWRQAKDSATRRFIEARIINDAGILGHYVADGSNPHHTTIHFDRWVGADNPKGYTTERGFHGRFESQFVDAHMSVADVKPLVVVTPLAMRALRTEVFAYLDRTHGYLDRLYALDKIEPFGQATMGAAHKRFTAERLAAGATMLRDAWWTAWITSE